MTAIVTLIGSHTAIHIVHERIFSFSDIIKTIVQYRDTLVHISISCNNILCSKEELDQFIVTIQCLPILESLDIKDNRICTNSSDLSSSGLSNPILFYQPFVQIIHSMPTLSKLWIENKIGAKGALIIANAIRTNINLTNLCLSHNSIRCEGALHIAEALKTNTSLTKLYLNSNRIGDHGACGLAAALTMNTTLIRLEIAYNEIGDTGIQEIATAIKSNSTLTTLSLSGINTNTTDATCLLDAFNYNSTIKRLYFYPSELDDRLYGYTQRNRRNGYYRNVTLFSLLLKKLVRKL